MSIHKKMLNVMLDLETLSVRPDAAIIVIGAIKFYRNGVVPKLNTMDSFYRRITIDSCKEAGLKIDQETIDWWGTQEESIRFESLENPDRIPLKQALEEFAAWMKPVEIVWGNGDDFDCTILGEAYTKCNMTIPWKFWNTRDLRTIMDLAGLRKSDLPSGDEHNALQDCYRQIIGLKKCLTKLKLI